MVFYLLLYLVENVTGEELGANKTKGKTFLTLLMNDQLICCLEIGVHEGIVCSKKSPILRGEL